MRPETGAKSLHLLPLIAFCTAAKAAPAQSLHLCDALVQNQKASRARPGSLQTRSSTLRPRESTHDQTTHDLMRIVSSAAAKAAQAPPSLFCDPILRQTSCPLRALESVGSGRCRRSRCGIPGEADLQEDARLAVYKLGEDANGELSPEPTRRGDLQVTAGLSSRMVARLLRFQGACIGRCGRTGDQSKTGRACMYFDSQWTFCLFRPAWM